MGSSGRNAVASNSGPGAAARRDGRNMATILGRVALACGGENVRKRYEDQIEVASPRCAAP